MSLREEICEELMLLDHLDQFTREDMKPRADRILKMIGKKIDSISECEESDEGGYHGDEEFWSGFQIGFEQAFIKIKEMLK